jgi:prepilin-type N-terminal cleavage/methylation domain-containing protein
MDCKPTSLDRVERRQPPLKGHLVRTLSRVRGARESLAAGFTLVEILVGMALGSLLLFGVASMYLFSLKSFTSMSNYIELNARNRYASDIVTRDIRSATGVTSADSQQLVLRFGGADLTYNYDEAARTLTRSYLERDEVLLKGVNSLSFSLYQRPTNGAAYEEFSVATATNAKLVGFQWECSRRVYGTQKNSQSLEAAIVKLRNK